MGLKLKMSTGRGEVSDESSKDVHDDVQGMNMDVRPVDTATLTSASLANDHATASTKRSPVPTLVCLVCAGAAYFSLFSTCPTDTSTQTFLSLASEVAASLGTHGSFASAVVFLALFWLFGKLVPSFGACRRAERAWAVGLAAVFSLSLSYNSLATASADPLSLFIALFMVIELSGYFLVCLFGLTFLYVRTRGEAVPKPTAIHRGAFFDFRVKNILRMMAIILVCWLPWIVLMRPGVLSPDTVAQVLWARGFPCFDPSTQGFLVGYDFSDQHPIFDTLIYGVFDRIGTNLGDAAIGYALLGICQAVLQAFAFAVACCFLHRRGLSRVWCIACLVFVSVMPCFGIFSQILVKDYTAVGFYVLWFIAYLEFVFRIREKRPVGARFMVAFILLACLVALTRKLGIYMVIIPMVFPLALLPRRKLSLATLMVPALLMFVFIPQVIYPTFKVAAGGIQEMLAVPLQQVAHCVITNEEDIGSSDLAVIDEVIDLDAIPQCYGDSADSIKDAFRHDASTGDVVAFLEVWVKLGLQHPLSYLQATSYQSPFYASGTSAWEPVYVHGGWLDFGGDEILGDYDEFTPSSTQQTVIDLVPETLYQLPVLGWLADVSLYDVFIPLFALSLCMLRRKGYWLLMVPILFSMLIPLVTSAFSVRFVINLVYCAPLVLAIPFLGAPRERATVPPGSEGAQDG